MKSGRIPTRTTRLNILRIKRYVDEENRRTIPTIAKLTGLTNFTIWIELRENYGLMSQYIVQMKYFVQSWNSFGIVILIPDQNKNAFLNFR